MLARRFGALVVLAGAVGCPSEYDEPAFRRALESAYSKANPGWVMFRREGPVTWYSRADQVDQLDVGAAFEAYRASGQSGSAFVEAWLADAQAKDAARRRTLEQSEETVIPLLKGEKWVQYQDLGAIGPPRRLPEIRPWRRPVAAGLFAVLGVPEEGLGLRFASLAEVERAEGGEDRWLDRSIENLARIVKANALDEDGNYRGVAIELKDRLVAFDLENVDGISGMLLDRGFRVAMLRKFGRDSLGAAAPLRNVLIVFDLEEPMGRKPVRGRTHHLYDTQNHPAFRGLLEFDEFGLSVLEPGDLPPN